MSPQTDSSRDVLSPRLRPEALDLLRVVGREAEALSLRAYLVGGPVRDALLGRPVVDLDVVVEGSARDLAEALAAALGARAVHHEAFGTAQLRLGDGGHVDLATARTEVYGTPGALPTVTAAELKADLARRDFSINALAACLSPEGFGTLLDPWGGYADLRHGLLRALHETSFRDDPTRIVRAASYLERLDLRLERLTADWLREAVEGEDLAAVTGARLGEQLRRALLTPVGPQVLLRLAAWGAATALGFPAGLEWPEALPELRWAGRVLQASSEDLAEATFALGTGSQGPASADFLHLGKSYAQAASQLDAALEGGVLDALGRAPGAGAADEHLARLRSGVVLALWTLSGGPARRTIERWREAARGLALAVTGEDLKRAGIAPGPAIAVGLAAARRAALDASATSAGEQRTIALRAAREAQERNGMASDLEAGI